MTFPADENRIDDSCFELLADGRNAFPEIIRCIRNAEKSIYINMFIWRNDDIGNLIAKELLAAADRGVSVTVSKDRYGVVCECSEENMRSFFNRRTSFSEKIKIAALKLFYAENVARSSERPCEDDGTLLAAMCGHPRITLSFDEIKADHSKFYIFDDSILILGGINIEDKENGADCIGRRYQDYMVKIASPAAVDRFLKARRDPGRGPEPLFGMNIKKPCRSFAMKDAYIRLIDEAESSLTVVMAYLSPVPEIEAALLAASRRGVDVRILIPRRANFQDALNKKAVNRLIAKSEGRISCRLFPGMNHTKLVMSEKLISFGSCNITKKAFRQLDELNLFVANDGGRFASALRADVEKNFALSQEVGAQLRYAPLTAAAESLFM